MSITVRPMRREDARLFLEIHHAAVRGIAAKDYPLDVVEAWAPPITDAALERFAKNSDNEIRLMAELDGKPVGIGCLLVATSELRACYVAPAAARRGIGSALVRAIERLAREHSLTYLELEASTTAEPFYATLGYTVVERGGHILSSGVPMAAVRMRKEL